MKWYWWVGIAVVVWLFFTTTIISTGIGLITSFAGRIFGASSGGSATTGGT